MGYIQLPPTSGGGGGSVNSVTGSSPISVSGTPTDPIVGISTASTSTAGALTSTDWNTFNNKVSATRAVNTSGLLTGGGDLSADRTVTLADQAQNTVVGRTTSGTGALSALSVPMISVITAADAAASRTVLGLGTIATQAASAVSITGGTVNGTSVGATTPSTGAFTTLSATGNTTLGDTIADQQVMYGTAFIGTGSGAHSLQVVPIASAVNSLQINGNTTGGFTQIGSSGSDTNISTQFYSKGSGSVILATGTGASTQLQVNHTASANRFVTITGSNGGNPTLSTSAGYLNLDPSTKGVVMPVSASDPSTPTNGTVYYNSSTSKLRVYAGGAWVDLH